MPGDWRFPRDVLGGAPFERQILAVIVTLPGRPAKLAPVLGTNRAGGDKQEQDCEAKTRHGWVLEKWKKRLARLNLMARATIRRQFACGFAHRIPRATRAKPQAMWGECC